MTHSSKRISVNVNRRRGARGGRELIITLGCHKALLGKAALRLPTTETVELLRRRPWGRRKLRPRNECWSGRRRRNSCNVGSGIMAAVHEERQQEDENEEDWN